MIDRIVLDIELVDAQMRPRFFARTKGVSPAWGR